MSSDELKAAELQVLAGHYSETCKFMKERQRRRDFYFLCLLLILTVFAAQYQDDNIASSIVKHVLTSSTDDLATAASQFTKCLLWLLLMGCVVRYFQTQIFLKKKYKYIHKIERVLGSFYSEEICFSREGAHYLSWFPHMSSFIRVLYQLVFPITLLAMTINRALHYDIKWSAFSLVDGVVLLCFLIILIATYSYCLDMVPEKVASEKKIKPFVRWYYRCMPIAVLVLSLVF